MCGDSIENFIELDYQQIWTSLSHPSGGFLGAWWHQVNSKDDKVQMYLQFEAAKLCFKIWYEGDERTETRERYRNALMEYAVNNPEITKPRRLGAGTYMTIAVINQDYIFGTGMINMKSLVERLHKYEKIIDAVMA